MDKINQPSHWVHDLNPFLIQFSDNFGIRYYGLGYLLGFVFGFWILHRAASKGRLPMPPAAVADLLTALIFGVIVGGRLGYFVLYEPATLFRSPLELFKVWQGGMASHGGFVGVALAMVWFARKQSVPFFKLTDAVVTAAPTGIFLVRIANFIKGELWGKESEVPWAVIFPQSAPDLPVIMVPPRHPSQLYEAALEGLALMIFTAWRYWRTDAPLRSPGRLTGEFLIGYAIARAISELFREPDASLIFGLSRGTFYSIFLVIGGILLIRRSSRQSRASPDGLGNQP